MAALAAMTTYLGYGFAVLHPSRSIYLPVLTLAIPFLQALCILLAFLLVWKNKTAALVALSPLIMDLGFFQAALSLHFPLQKRSNTISLLTWNTESLNFYHNTNSRKLHLSKSALRWLVSHPAQIKFLQEFVDLPYNQDFHTKKIFEDNGQQFVFLPYLVDVAGGKHGLAIATKGKIVRYGQLDFSSGSQAALWADIVLGRDTVRAVCVHLQSMAFKDTDFEVEDEKSLHHVLSRYARFCRIRSNQVLDLLNFFRRCPYPVVLAGDFNDPSHSYNHWKLSAWLTDCFSDSGLGMGFTLAKKPYFVRIDRIYVGTLFKPVGCRIIRELPVSDHFAVEAEVFRY